MALSLVAATNLMELTGLYNGQQTPAFLGLKGLCKQVGPFYIGFDTRIKPAVVRIFFDPTKSDKILPGSNKYVGLVQVGQTKYNGIPIEPGTYAKELEYRDYYDDFGGSPVPISWVDMVSEDIMKDSSLYSSGCYEPFFPLNAVIFDKSGYSYNDFCYYGKPNGNITHIPFGKNNNFCYAASIYSPIGLDFDGPSEQTLEDMLDKYLDRGTKPVKDQEASESDIDSKGMIKVAVDMLELAAEDIIWAQSVGKYLLIKLADSDGYCPYLCAYTYDNEDQMGKNYMCIYLLDPHEMDDRLLDLVEHLLVSFSEYRKKYNISSFSGFPFTWKLPNQKRGQSGLEPLPFQNKTVSPVVEFLYKTLAVTKFVNSSDGKVYYYASHGVQWRVLRILDLDQMFFGPLLICEPSEIIGSELYAFNSGKASWWSRYFNIMGNPNVGVQGEPEQEIWFDVPTDKYTSTTDGYGAYSTEWYKGV